jgi:chromosome segregation ATPase
MLRSFILASVLASFATLSCPAQSSQSGSDSGSTKPAPQSAPAPAAPPPAPAAARTTAVKDLSSGKDQAKEKKKPRKVWTEEEISTVGGSISVVGDPHASNSSSRAPASMSASDGRDAAYYRGRLAPLRQQIEKLDREIQEMKSVKGTVRENVEAQVQIREARREKIQKQINEIEEDARRHAIEPGELR